MRLIGLTGGIASGKSTVSGMLRALGAPVLDADAIYHELIRPLPGGLSSPLAEKIAARFPGVLIAGGVLDRTALGRRIFSDPAERAALDAIAHPAVAASFQERVAILARLGRAMAIYDVPLLFERGLERGLDGIIVVWVPQSTQTARLMARDRLDPDAAAARLAAQMPLDDKRDRATWVINNSGSLEQTRQQITDLWPKLQ